MEKCLYYNDHQTAATLMIDDLSFVSITQNGKITPQTDWGGGLSGVGSLYQYIADTFLTWFPETRGTFFFPISDHAFMNPYANYDLDYNRDLIAQRQFMETCSKFFEIAYHGTSHGRYRYPERCGLVDNWEQEFSYLTMEDVACIRTRINQVEKCYGIHMTGGKYPGYEKNEFASEIVEALGFRWWAADSDMIDRKCGKNRHTYYDGEKVLLLPTNISGSTFLRNISGSSVRSWKAFVKKKFPLLRFVFGLYKDLRAEEYITYLYENRLVLSVQEHFMNLRTDGKRQNPNIYDDVASVARIYALLRGMDVWHTTCGKLAHYLESYDHSRLVQQKDGIWKLSYHGSWDELFLTVCSTHSSLRNHDSGEIVHGVYRLGKWVFNRIQPGMYEEL